MEFINSILQVFPIEAIVALILGLFGGHFIKNLKKYLFKGSQITKQLGEAFLATSDVLLKADQAIFEDGGLKENSIKEIIEKGKEAYLEWEDVVIEIKPKKKKSISISSDEPELPKFPPKK